MQSSPRAPRKVSQLSDFLHDQLHWYSLAATAAGVGAVALAQSAQAKIIYTKADVKVFYGPVRLDLTKNGTADFIFVSSAFGTTGYTRSALSVKGALPSNGIWASGAKSVAPLAAGGGAGCQPFAASLCDAERTVWRVSVQANTARVEAAAFPIPGEDCGTADSSPLKRFGMTISMVRWRHD
jgi:hypothetical protein